MAKGDKFYFENFAASTALSKKAAEYLVECLENFNPDRWYDSTGGIHFWMNRDEAIGY